MARKIGKVAERYRKALDNLYAAQEKAEAARAAWLVEAARERKALVDELQEFAEAIGAIDAVREVDRLALSLDGRTLALVLAADGDTLDVQYPDSDDTVIALGPEGDWYLSRGGDSEPFLTTGLRRILAEGLGAPDPQGEFGQAPAGEESHPVEPVAAAVPAGADGRGARDGDIGHMGRSGTRSFKRAKDLPPGAVVKDIKGPLG